ncbi:MAG: cytochrome c [Deltaproteobacteria bacterium]|nr:cytochrome c [Deltaproteobacteria bacterium]
MKWLERFQTILLVAGVGFFVVAFLGMGVAPWTTLKDLTPPAGVAERTPQEEHGREIFMHEGCWHCHTQFVRPIAGEPLRYGPVSFAAEYLREVPQLFGTRRVGPDLAREAGQRPDDWHLAHFYNPRHTTPWSIMPGYPWLFETRDGRVTPTDDANDLVAYMQSIGRATQPTIAARDEAYRAQFVVGTGPERTPETTEHGHTLFARECQGCHGPASAEGGPAFGGGGGASAALLQPPAADLTAVQPTAAYVYQVLHLGIPGSSMPSFRDYRSDDLWAIAHYVQTLGKPDNVAIPELSEDVIAQAKAQFEMLCAVCHGTAGHGDGPAGLALRPAPPDLHGLRPSEPRIREVIESGVPGTAMAPFPQITPSERRRIATYLQRLWQTTATGSTP